MEDPRAYSTLFFHQEKSFHDHDSRRRGKITKISANRNGGEASQGGVDAVLRKVEIGHFSR
jgi:hypothetical protein